MLQVFNIFDAAFMNLKPNWDALGMFTSVACAIHCAILPLLVASLPVFGVNIVENEAFEYGMIFLALIVGILALRHGYRKHHRSLAPILFFVAGICFLFAKQIWSNWHTVLLLPAVLLILTAHYMNYRNCRKVSQCNTDNCNH